jgi:hypothetical protein
MESFVDVSYHGIELARRVKLSDVAPNAGYLEVAAPMPVGTTVVLSIEGGISITATVRGVHEQVGGSERPPGMRVAPTLEGEAATRWWAERVTVIADGAPASRRTHEMTAQEDSRAKDVAERARADSGAPPFLRRDTREMPSGEIRAAVLAAAAEEQKLGIPRKPVLPDQVTPADGVPSPLADEDGLVDDGRRTEVMSAVDPEILARLTGGDMPLVDDGKRTTVMDVPPVMDDDGNGNGNGDEGDDEEDNGSTSGEQPLSPSASGNLRASGKKRRRKRR